MDLVLAEILDCRTAIRFIKTIQSLPLLPLLPVFQTLNRTLSLVANTKVPNSFLFPPLPIPSINVNSLGDLHRFFVNRLSSPLMQTSLFSRFLLKIRVDPRIHVSHTQFERSFHRNWGMPPGFPVAW